MPATAPGGVATDDAGNVYVANTGKDTVAKYLAGETTPVWEIGRRGAEQAVGAFDNPRDVAVLDDKVYVAAPGGVQVLSAADGQFLRNMSFPWRTPMGISTGNDTTGAPLILVSNGGSGNVEIFDGGERHVRTIPPRTADAGTRDADTDSQGNVYVADYRGDRINKYSPTGALLTSWQGTGSSCQRVPDPYGVEVDDADRIYVASSGNNLIRAYRPDGSCIRSYGRSGTSPTQLSQLRRVAVTGGPDPTIIGADLWGLKLLFFAVDGSFAAPVQRLGDGQYPPVGRLNEAPGLVATAAGVYVTDLNSHRITRWDHGGALLGAFGTKGRDASAAQFNWPDGIGADPRNGNVWVADTHSNILKEFRPDGAGPIRSLGLRGTVAATFKFPHGVTVDGQGNLYVADALNGGRVISFSATLQQRWVASGVSAAWGITWDPTGNRVLATAPGSNGIFALQPDTGAKTRLPIGVGGAPGSLAAPLGVAVDAGGNIWVGDTGNNRVQRFRPDGSFSGEAFGSKGSGPGQFNHPAAISVAPNGLVYVADDWNSRVVVLRPSD